MQYKVEIKNMRLVEVIQPKPQVEWFKSEAAPDVEFNKAYMNWLNLSKNQKSYPILASDLQYWQPLDGKIVGEGEFEVTQKASEENGKPIHYFYAIPIQPNEQGEVWLKETREKVGNAIMYYSNPQATGIIMSIIENCIRFPPITPATPASSDVWEEVHNKCQRRFCAYLPHSLLLMNILDYLKQNYSLTKKPQ